MRHEHGTACLMRLQVLDGCPWVLPRPVFVLTSQQWGWKSADGIQSTYTLRVKVVKEGAADAIAQVGSHPGLTMLLRRDPLDVRRAWHSNAEVC